jgi:hypothetical protein
MRLWNPRDVWAGHVRRYERDQLKAVLVEAGFQIETFECYGFPLTNLTEWVSGPIFARQIHVGGEDSTDNRRVNNDRSGIDRNADLRLYPIVRSFPGKLAMRCAFALQRLFLKTDLGSGYVVKVRRA